MPYILKVSPHLTMEEVVIRFQRCTHAGERLRWQAVMLKGEGRSAVDIADICKKKVDWVRRTVRRYNAAGPDSLKDHRESNGQALLLDTEALAELAAALLGPSPDGGFWTGKKVSRWIGERTGRPVSEHTGVDYLRRLKFTKQVPRPKHPDADERAQVAFKKGGLKVVFETSFEDIQAPKFSSGPRTKPASG